MSSETSPPAFPPFDDSRRLLGPNLHFDVPGVVLETTGEIPADEAVQGWAQHVVALCAWLRWPVPRIDARRHASGVALAFTAPRDQLFCATEVNELAWLRAVRCHGAASASVHGFHAPGHPAAWDDDSARATLSRMAAAERRPDLMRLIAAAQSHGLRLLVDDDEVSIGGGDGAQSWRSDALPDAATIDWSRLRDVPTALVTGSNGKTTTVRLLAAMLRAHGLRTAWSCTDGLFADGDKLQGGDYSGPAGARAVLRHPGVEAAVLESARGGLLRRGLALDRADVAVVTNISVDHFGEYGIHDLDGLADAKLIVTRAVPPPAWLVLNADDEVLWRRQPPRASHLALFALDHAAPRLVAHRAAGGASCGFAGRVLRLHWQGVGHDLAEVDAMPLAFGGSARHNLANLATAALAAAALGIAPATIASVLTRFGASAADNPGRLQLWRHRDATVIVDYAHNVDGLRGLLEVAASKRAAGARLALLLGQAGNRRDAQIRELAEVVADFAPARVVLKDIEGFMRGRAAGEVATLLRDALQARGVAPDTIDVQLDEVAAARALLAWARPGDVVVLPLHATAARDAIVAELQRS
jgi:cyanophycin synthetase